MRNNKWKKICSCMLAVCLVGTLFYANQSSGVFAEETEQKNEVTTAKDGQVNEAKDEKQDTGTQEKETVDGTDSGEKSGTYSNGDVEESTLNQDDTTEEEIDKQSVEDVDSQSEDSKISELINADVTLLKWKSKGGTATVTLDGTVYNITDEQSYQNAYETVYKQMLDNTTSITDDLSAQTISKDTIWNVSNNISMSGNITVESGVHLIIIGTGTITKNGDYGIIVKGGAYLQGKVYFNGNQKNSALVQIQSGEVFLADDFHLGNNGGNGITANGGKIYMIGGLIGTKNIDFEWKDGDNNKIDQKNYEQTLSYINENLSSAEYNYISQIMQRGGNKKGIQLDNGAELYMNRGVIAGNGNATGSDNGISATSQCKIVMSGGTIIGNQAGNGKSGGGLNIGCSTMISGGMIVGNHSGGYAGGINMSGSTTLTGNAIIAFNSCAYNGGGMLIAQNATCTMTGDAAVVHNRAVGANNTPNSGKGGAFRVVGNLIINDGKINYNSGNGPLDSKTVEQDIGGAISAQTDVLTTGEIRVATITLNGGEIAYNKANGRGGAIWMVCAANKYTATFELNGTNIHHNTAVNSGGAIFLDARNGTLNANIKSGRLADNSSGDKGGGIYLLLTEGATALTVNIGEKDSQPTALEVVGNKSGSIGGGLYVARAENSTGTSDVNLYNGTLSDNQAQKGGAIGVSQGNLNVYGGKFENNTADINGGGAYVENGEVTVADGNFQSNTAQNGGGAYIASGKLTVSAGSFYDNKAILNGGGAYVADGQVRMFGGSLSGNTAQNGGGFYLAGGQLYTIDGKIQSNTAKNGAGAYVADSSIRMFGGTFASNKATESGGGMYVSSTNQAADVVIRSGKLTDNTAESSDSDQGNGGAIAVVSSNSANADHVIIGLREEHKGLDLTTRTFTAFPYKDDKDNNTEHTHESCPEISGNTASGNGGGIYMSSSTSVLDIYCMLENNNTAEKDTTGGSLMSVGGNVNIGDVGNDGNGNNTKDAVGNIFIQSPMLVKGGNVKIYGNTDNPKFTDKILVDMRKDAGTFNDYRYTMAAVGDNINYKIEYFENFEGSGAFTSMQYSKSAKITAMGNMYIHEGYKIVGWDTQADGKGTRYQTGNLIASADDHSAWDGKGDKDALRLYAIWQKVSYTVVYNPNAEKYSGKMASEQFTYDVQRKLSDNAYKVDGKRFVNWNTQEDGKGTSYEASYNESKMTNIDGKTIPLYAQWVDCTHLGGDHPGTLSYTVDRFHKILTETCDCGGHTASVTISGADVYYDGNDHLASLNYSNTFLAGNQQIAYTYKAHASDTSYGSMPEGTTVPKNIGYYRASITVNEQTIYVEYQIKSPAAAATIDASAIRGQYFKNFNGSATCSTAKDDAFTVQYDVQSLNAGTNEGANKAYRTAPVLTVSQSLPAGTTVIMQTSEGYWYYKQSSDNSGTKIELSSFTKMGTASDKFAYDTSDIKDTQMYRFIVDFSGVNNASSLNGDLKVGLKYAYTNPTSGDLETSQDKETKITVSMDNEATFAVGTSGNVCTVTAPSTVTDTRWERKTLVWKIASANENVKLPADAKLTLSVTEGENVKTAIYSMNKNGEFMIPFTWTGNQGFTLALSSNQESAVQSYDLTTALCVGSKVSGTTQPSAKEDNLQKASATVSLNVPVNTAPAVKITGVKDSAIGNGAERVFSNKDTLNVNITTANVDGCKIQTIIQKKADNTYMGEYYKEENVSAGSHSFSLQSTDGAGSYRLLLTVSSTNGRTLLEVPYYFIVQ